jgi:hypothetical protein
VRPHRRFARRGWIEVSIETDFDVARALRWLRRAYRDTGTATDDADADG